MLFGTAGAARVLGAPDVSPLAVAADRLVLAGVLLLAVARPRGALAGAGGLPRGALAAGVVGAAGFQLAFFSAVDAAGVAVATVVSLGTAPVVTGLLARALGQPPPPPAWYVATGLGLAGVGLLVSGSGGAAGAGGIGLAALAGASYGVYVVANRRLLDTGVAGLGVVATVFAGAAVVMLPVALLARPALPWAPAPVLTVVFLALGPTVAAYLLLARALSSLPPASVVTLGLAEPLTGAVLGTAVLGERLGAAQVGGAALVLAGLAALTVAPPGVRRAARTGRPSRG